METVNILALGFGFLFVAAAFTLACKRPLSTREIKQIEKDNYLRGKK